MKKITIKNFCRRAVAVAAGAAVMVQAQVPTFVRAAQATEYISEIYLSYGKTPEEAKEWLIANGYNVLNQDLNEGAQGGITADWLSWTGMHSEKRSVYLGYKTTTDKDEAITDMRAMNMNGNFSYEAYEKVLEERRELISALVEDAKAALAEYRQNYKAGRTKALLAHDMLNKLTDDDCDKAPLGDLLLAPVKEEMTAEEYEADPKKHADMTTIILQGNSEAVKLIMEYLAYASDTGKGTWLERLDSSDGINGIYDRYEEEYSNLSESKQREFMRLDYDEDAKTLSHCIEDLRNGMKIYTESGLTAGSGEAEVDAYFEEHKELDRLSWASAAIIYEQLGEINFEDMPLSEFIMDEKNDFSDVETRTSLYPIVDALSDGQISLLSYVDLSELIYIGGLDDEGWGKFKTEMEETYGDEEARSVYSCVDRSAFTPGGVALTGEARSFQNSTGTNFDDGILGVGLDWKPFAFYGTGGVMLIAGISSYAYGKAIESSLPKTKDRLMNIKSRLDELDSKMDTVVEDYLRDQKVLDPTTNLLKEIYDDEADKILAADIGKEAVKEQQKYIVWVEKNGVEREYVEILYTKDGGEYRIFEPIENIGYDDLPKDIQMDINSQKNLLESERENLQKEVQSMKGVLVDEQGGVSIDEDRLLSKSNGWKEAGKWICLAAALIAMIGAGITIYEVYQYYHQDLAPIPRTIVSESSDEKGRSTYTYYRCVLCNRAAQGFGNDTLGSYGDMNGDVGKQWLALYTTKDKAAGDPLTASLLVQKGSNKMPLDKTTGIKLFGNTDTVNLVSEDYGYNDSLGGLYIFCGTDNTAAAEKPAPNSAKTETAPAADSKPETESKSEETTASEGTVNEVKAANTEDPQKTGSVVGSGTMVMSCGLSAAAGALICFLITRKKRAA